MTPTAPYVLPGPSLLHGLHWLLAFAELDAVVSEGRDFLNHGRASHGRAVVSEARTRIGGQG